jgi:dihydroxy-acid dehydratase
VNVDVFALINELGERVPVLSAVAPNGPDTIDAFEAAGGGQALLKQLEPLLDGDALTVTGRTIGENLATVTVANTDVIRPLSQPFSQGASIVVLSGSLAPESAIVNPGRRAS